MAEFRTILELPKTRGELVQRCREVMRLKRMSYHTEKSYLFYIRGFLDFHANRRPELMGAPEVRSYLSHLATEKQVAASTQNVAFNALLFLYRQVLEMAFPDISDVVRAHRPKRLPVVLSHREVLALLEHLEGVPFLVTSLLYGAGLRLSEAQRLRVKDVDFERGLLLIYEAKGDKDRVAILPTKCATLLKIHLQGLQEQWNIAPPSVPASLPHALSRKYAHAGLDWPWQYVFPAAAPALDPQDGQLKRHHILEDNIQNAVRRAAKISGLPKPSRPMFCAIRLRLICSKAAMTFAPFKTCSATKTCEPPKFICTP